MTKQELLNYYTNLLIIQYRNKPKAKAHIELLADIMTCDLLPLSVRDSFDIENAEGEQLDVLGKYFNAPRTGYTLTGLVTLVDEDYRQLLKILLVTNYSDATLYEMQKVLFENFGTAITLYDYKDMRMGYFLSIDIISSTLAQFVVVNNLLPYPMAVSISATIYVEDISLIYGFVDYDYPIPVNRAPMNSYADFNDDLRWLSYKDAIILGAFNIDAISEEGDEFILEDDSELIFE